MVSVETIKTVIADQEQDFSMQLKGRRIIPRELKISEKKLDSGVVGIVTGVRRCGKSVLAQLAFSGTNFGYINFEDARLTLKAEELNNVLEAIYSLKGHVDSIVLDEIQNVTGWEKFAGRLAASKRVIITGSNARLESRELATYLVGRHIDFELFPFSFREFITYRSGSFDRSRASTTEGKARVMALLVDYIRMGGMPQSSMLGRGYLAGLYTEIVERDVSQRYGIKHASELRELANYLASNFSSEITSNKLKGIINIKTANTVSRWVGYLEGAYLFFKLERFSSKLKDRIKAPKKIYMIDTGMLCAVYPEAESAKGRLIENLVAVEIKRRISYQRGREALYYWKGTGQEEVDFLLRSGTRTTALIQVTYSSSKNDIKDREVNALLKASIDQRCNNLIILTWDYDGESMVEGKKVRFVPLRRWLLDYDGSKVV